MSRHKTAIWETRSRERLLCTTLHDQSSSPCTSHTFPVKKTDTTCVTSTVHSYYLNLPVTILPSTTHFTKREQLGKEKKRNRETIRTDVRRDQSHTGTQGMAQQTCPYSPDDADRVAGSHSTPPWMAPCLLPRLFSLATGTATDALNQIALSFRFVPSACRGTNRERTRRRG
jgi:hypothetical protein